MHDVINGCTIARFEHFHVKSDNGEIQRIQQTFAYDAYLGPIQHNGHTLGINNWTKTSSCPRPSFPKIEFAAQLQERLAKSKLQLTVSTEVKKIPRYLICLTQFNTKPSVEQMFAHKLS
jgi:hypothetical protein